MTGYEILTLLIALLGGIVSVISLVRTRKVEALQMQLQRRQDELAKRQLETMDAESAALQRALVVVTMEGFSRHYRFVIRNHGPADAQDVNFRLDLEGGKRSPLVSGDYDHKIPITVLAPGAECSLLASITLGMDTVFHAWWSWRNVDGTITEKRSVLTLP